jgi:hypothetical protein
MLPNLIGRSIRFSIGRGGGVGYVRGMATAIDPRGSSPDPPKPGKTKRKGWDRATFTIKVDPFGKGTDDVEWSCFPWDFVRSKS